MLILAGRVYQRRVNPRGDAEMGLFVESEQTHMDTWPNSRRPPPLRQHMLSAVQALLSIAPNIILMFRDFTKGYLYI